MEKLDLFNGDGSKFVISQDNEKESKDDLPQRSHFEVNVNSNSNLAIEMEGSEESIIYDGLSGDILHTGTKLVFPGSRLTSGSTLGVTTWTVKEQEEKSYSLIKFTVNGEEACRKAIRFNGVNVSPVVHVESESSSVNVNLGETGFKYDKGNI